MTIAVPRRSLWRDPLLAVAAVIILLTQAIVVWRALPRALDHDEGEHLRAAAWMASGQTLYRDFAENHTPFLYMILAPFAPAANEEIDATRRYAMIARAFSAIAGIAAVVCIAAIGVHLAGDAMAAIPILAALLATSWTWLRGVADVRSEPYTLLLFWAGALLVVGASSLTRRGLLAAGAGIGLIAIADLWNPKWPLESLVILGLYLVLLWRHATGVAPAASPAMTKTDLDEHSGTPAGEATGATLSRLSILASLGVALLLPVVALCLALRVTTLRDLFFFSFTFASAVSRWYRGAVSASSAGGFAFCPAWLSPLFAALAAAFLLWHRRRLTLPSLLLFATAIEVVFLYPYPHLWPQYLVMWSCVVALLGGVVIAELATSRAVRTFITVAIVLAFVSHDWTRVKQRASERPWQTMAALQHRLAPGEAAWVRPEELPTAVRAGSFYWYAFSDQVPFSLTFARATPARGFLPHLRDEDLPPCRIARGIDAMHVRLLDERAVENLPASQRCMEDLLRRGSLRKIAGTPIWEVVR